MKFLVPNYSYLQNPWLRGYRPQIPVLSVLGPQLNLLNPPPPRTKFLGTPLHSIWPLICLCVPKHLILYVKTFITFKHLANWLVRREYWLPVLKMSMQTETRCVCRLVRSRRSHLTPFCILYLQRLFFVDRKVKYITLNTKLLHDVFFFITHCSKNLGGNISVQ